jgi:hypothetical protein
MTISGALAREKLPVMVGRGNCVASFSFVARPNKKDGFRP